jgi:integrase
VAYSKSGSARTEASYRRNFHAFLKFLGKTAEGIKADYEHSTDRKFKRIYAEYLRAWIASLDEQGLTNSSIKVMVAAVQSFFKYTDLPLGYVPLAQDGTVFHNRDMTRQEIAELLTYSNPRDRAFFVAMAQSGLRPYTICKLRLKHLQPDLYNGTIPCKIDVPKEIAKGKYHSYFTFVGTEAVKHLKDYLKTRQALTSESYLFTTSGTEEPLSPKAISAQFNKTVRKLRKKGILDFKQPQRGKPAELRLYNLRKWFKKHSHEAGEEFQEFWMGHKSQGVIDNYRTRDLEFHRKLYAEKAMPFLRIEEATPSETEQTIKEMRNEIEELREENAKLQQRVSGATLTESQVQELLRRIEKLEKARKQS